jgi:integrase
MPRGFGRILLHPKSQTWFIAFYRDGQEIRESVAKLLGKPPRDCTQADAARALKRRLGELHAGQYLGPSAERLTVAAVLEAYQAHLEAKGAKAILDLRGRIACVKAQFGTLRVRAIDTARIERWTAALREDGYAPASINSKVRTFRTAMNHARKAGRLLSVPHMPTVSGEHVRQGFVTRPLLERIVKHLPDPVNDAARFAFLVAWRKEEVLTLTWPQIHRAERTITLPTTKNGKPRTIAMVDEVAALIEARWAMRQGPFVFHKRGRRFTQHLRRYWNRACAAVGAEGLVFHDLRRSGVRNLIRAGVTETVAMSISGHRSLSMFQRYNITSLEDQAAAFTKLGEYFEREGSER